MKPAELAELRAVLDPTAILVAATDTARYEIDERRLYRGRAGAVVRPGSTGELARVVAWCHARRIAMVPHGGNTSYCGGATPDASGTQIVISLERMNRLRSLDPAAFALTVEAGMTLAAVQERAAAAGLLFPLSMGSEGSAQIGGALSTNAGGVAVLRYGTARDLVLGLEVVLPDGRIWDGLRCLRKDNTGYDLRQCFIGAEGTLGIITAAVLKLFPGPLQRETAWLAVADVTAACDVLAALRQRLGDCMSSFEYVSAASLGFVRTEFPELRAPPIADGGHLLVEFTAGEGDGLRGAVERALSALLETERLGDAIIAGSVRERQDFWRLRESVPAAEKALGGSLKHDVSVRIDRMPQLVERLSDAVLAYAPAARLSVYGHVGDGNLHFNVLAPAGVAPEQFKTEHGERISDLVHAVTGDLEGSFSAEHGVGRLKRELLARTESAVALDLMHALKRAFDPLCLMNPGKVLACRDRAS